MSPSAATDHVLSAISQLLGGQEAPVFFQQMAAAPAYLESAWNRYRAVMENGEVDRNDKEWVAFGTAVAQASRPVIDFQRQRLQQRGFGAGAITEALAVCDFFEGFDSFAHALHIDSELRPRKLMSGDFSLIDQEIDVNVPYVLEPEDPVAKGVYDEIKKTFGMPFVPNIFKAAAHFPAGLKAKWESYKAIMLQGELPHLTKELIAVSVSAVNSCFY